MRMLQTKPVPYSRRDNPRQKEALVRSVGPRAIELASALLVRNGERALGVLVRASNEGWELRDVEQMIIAPAVARVCQMRVRGRVDESTFNQAGALAESVERSFRAELSRKCLATMRRYTVSSSAR